MDIFGEVQDVLAGIAQTPREFLVATMGKMWEQVPIACMRLQPESETMVYLAVFDGKCPDCGEPVNTITLFVRDEQGKYRYLPPESVEFPV